MRGGEPVGAVDAHHHLWDPADAGQEWLQTPGHEVLRRPFIVEELRVAATGGVGGAPLAASVVVQSVARADETRRLLVTAASHPLVAGAVGWVDLTADVPAQLDALRAGPGGERLVGVRHLVQDEPDAEWLVREDVLRGLAALVRQDLPFDLLVREPQRDAALQASRRVLGLRVVLDHAGKPDLRRGSRADLGAWASWVRNLAALDGAVCKVSGLVTEADRDWSEADLRPAWDTLLEAFGPQRLLFGSDWPVCLLAASWRRWADAVDALAATVSADEREMLVGGAARAAYALPRSRTAVGVEP